MLHTAGEAESTAGHGDRRTGAGRPRYMALDWENRHVRVRLERPLHQVWVKLRESGGFQDDSSFSSGAPGRCRPGPGLGAGYGTGSSFSYITAVLGSIRNTQCACATRWIVPLIYCHRTIQTERCDGTHDAESVSRSDWYNCSGRLLKYSRLYIKNLLKERR